MLWGAGKDENELDKKALQIQSHGSVIGVVDSNNNKIITISKYEIVTLALVCEYAFDYLVILPSSARTINEILHHAVYLGVQREKIIHFSIFQFGWEKYLELKKGNYLLFHNSVGGGLTCHRLNLKFNSPFVNLWIPERDYIRLAEGLEMYMDEELVFERYAEEKTLFHQYPVMRLGDIEVHFNHTSLVDRALCDWERRKQRIDYKSLFFMFRSNSTENINRIMKIKEKKVIFTNLNIENDDNTYIYNISEEGNIDQIINSYPLEYKEPYNPIDLLLR